MNKRETEYYKNTYPCTVHWTHAVGHHNFIQLELPRVQLLPRTLKKIQITVYYCRKNYKKMKNVKKKQQQKQEHTIALAWSGI